MTIIPALTVYGGAVPDKATMTTTQFADAVHPFMAFYDTTTVPEINAHRTAMNTLSGEIQTVANDTVTVYNNTVSLKNEVTLMKDITVDASNYLGDWVANYISGSGYPIGASVTYSDGKTYMSKVASNLAEPVSLTSDANWYYLDRQTFNYKILTADTAVVHRDYCKVDTTVAIAQVDTIDTLTVLNSTAYTVTIDTVAYTYTSTATATAAGITAGITAAINADANVAVTAVDNSGVSVVLTAKVAGVAFTATINANMVIATTTANKPKEVSALLPATPLDNTLIGFMDLNSSFDLNKMMLVRGDATHTINGELKDMDVTTKNVAFLILYTNGNWRTI